MNKRIAILAALLIAAAAAAVVIYSTRQKTLYAEVVFGPNQGTTIWVVAQGMHLYIDRDDSDGIQPDEYLGETAAKLPFVVTSSDGTSKYQNVSFSLQYVPSAVREDRPQELNVDVDVTGVAEFSQYGAVKMDDEPDTAPCLRVDGPLKLGLRKDGPPVRLALDGQPTKVFVSVNTVQPDNRAWMMVYSSNRRDRSLRAFPPGVAHVLEVKFPPAAANTEPVVRRFTLNEFC